MSSAVFYFDSNAGDDRFVELEGMVNDFFRAYYRVSFIWMRAMTVSRSLGAMTEVDLARMAWKKLVEVVSSFSWLYLPKENESADDHSRRLCRLWIETAKAVVLDAEQNSVARRIEQETASPPSEAILHHFTAPPDNEANFHTQHQTALADPEGFHREIVLWADGLDDDLREIVRIVVKLRMPTREQIRCELRNRNGKNFNLTEVGDLCLQLKAEARGNKLFSIFFSAL